MHRMGDLARPGNCRGHARCGQNRAGQFRNGCGGQERRFHHPQSMAADVVEAARFWGGQLLVLSGALVAAVRLRGLRALCGELRRGFTTERTESTVKMRRERGVFPQTVKQLRTYFLEMQFRSPPPLPSPIKLDSSAKPKCESTRTKDPTLSQRRSCEETSRARWFLWRERDFV
jgi:hypothetical protein